MTLREKTAHYRKAVEAGIGSVLMILTSLLALGDVLPAGTAVVVTTTIAVLTTARVWLAKNADLIDNAADSIDGLQRDVRADVPTRGKHARQ
ncbi:hypothetical protein [Rhodococcus phage REQ1]|uniref:hypothetical protein n=1 Tax=Rhodococcus phage REQ1 TaxID=1109712 RepID=UPI00023EEC76|nr:hypothetical protein RoPhREQ1_gp84 [Rhodococcus phage REQ1]AEV52080.1 hypothetical protein [Rhodococcus phage REQ1]